MVSKSVLSPQPVRHTEPRQVALVAGDSHVYPIVSLDGRQVTPVHNFERSHHTRIAQSDHAPLMFVAPSPVSRTRAQIGEGAVGPITRELMAMLEADAVDGDDDHHDVPGLR